MGFSSFLVIPTAAIFSIRIGWNAARFSNQPLITLLTRDGIVALTVIMLNILLPSSTLFLVMYASDGGDPMRSIETAIAWALFALLYYGLIVINYVLAPGFIIWSMLCLWRIANTFRKSWKSATRVFVVVFLAVLASWAATLVYQSVIAMKVAKQNEEISRQQKIEVSKAVEKEKAGIATDEDCNMINMGQRMPSSLQNACWKAKNGACVQCTAGELMKAQAELGISMEGFQNPDEREINICTDRLREHAIKNKVDENKYVDQNADYIYRCVIGRFTGVIPSCRRWNL